MTLFNDLLEVLEETPTITDAEEKLKLIYSKLGGKYTKAEIDKGILTVRAILKTEGY